MVQASDRVTLMDAAEEVGLDAAQVTSSHQKSWIYNII